MHKNALTMMVALSLAACAPTTQGPDISSELANKEAAIQRELAVKENMAGARRLQNIAAPILMANAELCDDLVTPYIGAEFVTKDAVAKDYQETMANLYGAGSQPTVTIIGRKTPAARALKIGDMITHIDGAALPEGKKSLSVLKTTLAKNVNAAPMTLTVNRGGNTSDIRINPVHACDSPVRLVSSDAVNASADGSKINITKGMMRFAANDTELATVIGHELAHNSRTHIDSKRGNAAIGTVLGVATSVIIGVNVANLGASLGAGANSQAFESEADYVGLYHTARAGYNIQDAPNLWRRMAASNPGAIHIAGSTHPSTAKRFLSLEATVAEINAKKARGAKLIPEERKVEPAEQKTGVND